MLSTLEISQSCVAHHSVQLGNSTIQLLAYKGGAKIVSNFDTKDVLVPRLVVGLVEERAEGRFPVAAGTAGLLDVVTEVEREASVENKSNIWDIDAAAKGCVER